MHKIDAVDLFCGAGGLTAGLIKAGITVRAGYDIDLNCEYAYQENNGAKFVAESVQDVDIKDVAAWYRPDRVKLLAGCAPCQPFSTYNQGRDTSSDRKWPLLYSFEGLIKGIEPELVTMENVPDVTKHKVYHDFVQSLKNSNYHIWAETIHCVDYGLPQQRRRHVLLASKLGPISMIPKTHQTPMTVEKAIGHLPKLSAGECDPEDTLHRAATLNPLNLKRIMLSKPGGTWRDWPESLRAACHLKPSGKTYASVYGRMRGDEPSPTMTTLCYGFGNGRFGHFDERQNRAISLREAATLQSFPDDYKFMPPEKITFKAVGRMIGNAVPVRLGEIIGLSIQRHLDELR
ncbi:DNA cytosine methyltransferase [Pseudomonas ogarae]|uniref:Cytosine-specific methyltransferase n=1 Tax=Pseudomonas ogarae (strain DSM 112162 / CECT 30235 / F113) TaxID=1114970 RepID=A0ABM6R3R5_PSEO1|nr:DNA cytosine methyltransferase [Pseudomonas ogarae]AEV64275.1 DNA-cytosine methyltransferase [Pseudomonas ogarae]AUO48105.1 DNA cytosine methyltransferase [Pseudomonas ogarae]